MQELRVDLDNRSYSIHIGSDTLSSVVELLEALKLSKHLVVVTNDVVAPLYLEQVTGLLRNAEYNVDCVILPDGEQHKDATSLNAIYTRMLERNCDRDTAIVALGGGVIGDMAGFAAATYMRGIPFVQIPTTLLAQVDSSVGGKTAINHPLGKNMIGAFYQPRSVIIDVATLDTLDERHFRAGLAEVVKYGVIADADFFSWLEQNIPRLLSKDPAALEYAIKTCCSIKAAIVAQDETEHSVRALLNFGHTFGHALEQLGGYGTILHGEGVAIGMAVATRISALKGLCSTADVARLDAILIQCGLDIHVPQGFTPEQFVAAMMRDKKVSSGTLRMVLAHGIGTSEVQAIEDPLRTFTRVLADSSLVAPN
ncbi:MAG: 3-dehydroquinate synthase [Desulfuromonadaceae bacterium]